MIQKTPWDQYGDSDIKLKLFLNAVHDNAVARDSKGREYLLRGLKYDAVEYVGNEWRLLNTFEDRIRLICGEEFILGERLKHIKDSRFEFYRARPIGQNCNGRRHVFTIEVIVVKYKIGNQTYWVYGNTIEEAYAALSGILYDKYTKLINSVAAVKNRQRSK